MVKRKTIDVKTGRQIDDSDHSSEDRDKVGDVQVLSYIEASEQTRQSHSYLNFSTGQDTYADTESELNKMTLKKKNSIKKQSNHRTIIV